MQRTEILKERLIQMEIVLSSYIEFKKDEKKLGKYIEKKATDKALQHEESLEKKRAIIRKRKKTVNKINELLLKVLSENNWGIYFKGEPMQSIPMNDGAKVYKVKEVKAERIYEEIQKEIESDWQKQNEQTENKSLNG